MMWGPDRIVACPICHAAARVGTLLSGNTFGAIVFTDGKMIASMLPDMPALARCKGCGVFYWLSDAEQVGETSGGPDASSVDLDVCARAERVEMLSEVDYAEALAAGLASDRERELYLRVRLWWEANDRNRRAPRNSALGWSADLAENLERLDQLLDEADPHERLMKAEAARETGDFDEAARLLDHDFPEECTHAATTIRGLAAEAVSVVRMIPAPSRGKPAPKSSSPPTDAASPGPTPSPPGDRREVGQVSPPRTPREDPRTGKACASPESEDERASPRGRSFTNLQVRGRRSEDVERALEGVIRARAYVSSEQGEWVQVCDEAAASADFGELHRVARELSARLRTGVFAFRLIDDDVLWYDLYEEGVLVDEFDSWPNGYREVDDATRARFRGDPGILARYWRAGAPTEGIDHVLKPTRLFEKNVDIGDKMPYLCAEDRLRHLADLLGFSEQRCCLGFTEVAAGTFCFTLEDVFTEGALEQDREAASGFRLISGGRDRQAIDGENLGSP